MRVEYQTRDNDTGEWGESTFRNIRHEDDDEIISAIVLFLLWDDGIVTPEDIEMNTTSGLLVRFRKFDLSTDQGVEWNHFRLMSERRWDFDAEKLHPEDID